MRHRDRSIVIVGLTVWSLVMTPSGSKQRLLKAAGFKEAPSNKVSWLDGGLSTNLHIAMVGDSLTRYQYLSLVYYLQRQGQWINGTKYPNPLLEKHFEANGSWPAFFSYTNQGLNGNEQCDCYRSKEWEPKDIRENRYYANFEFNNHVTYIQKFGYLPAHGKWSPKEIMDHHQLSDYWTKNYTYAWSYNWVDTIRLHLANLEPRPRYVVLNAGLWAHDLDNETHIYDIKQALDDNSMIGIYKTTTAHLREGRGPLFKPRHHDTLGCNILHYCLNLSWTSQEEYNAQYWDTVHFLPPIYQHMNEQLFGLIQKIEHNAATHTARQEAIATAPPAEISNFEAILIEVTDALNKINSILGLFLFPLI